MATSPTYTDSKNNVKWHYEVTFSESQNAIKFTAKVVLDNVTVSGKSVKSKFPSKETYKIEWTDPAVASDYNSDSVSGKTGNYTFNPKTVSASKVEVKITAHKQTWTKTYTASTKVRKPDTVTAKKINNGKYEISVSGQGTPENPASEIVIERADNGGAYYPIIQSPYVPPLPTSNYSFTVEDTQVAENGSYKWRAKVVNSEEESDYTYSNSGYTQPTTSAVISVKEVGKIRVLSWTLDSVADINNGVTTGWIVQVEENDTGIFLPIGVVVATPLLYKYSWIHIPIAGTSSRYRLLAFGKGGVSYAGGSASDQFTAPPTKPRKLEAYRTPDVNVVINITDKESNTADEVHIERSIDGEEWDEIDTMPFPCAQYLDTTVIGNREVKYRLRNSNSKGFSDYVETGVIPLLSQPNPPTLLEPFNNALAIIDDITLELLFQHNPTDGTPQRNATVQIRVNGGAWEDNEVGEDSYLILDLSQFNVNDLIEWRVQTQGSHASYSDWSDIYKIVALKRPQMDITSPINNQTISTFPVTVAYRYVDESGALEDLTISILRNEEVEATYTPDIGDGATGNYSFPLTGFLFETENNYEIRIDALSSSGLTASDAISIYVEYETSSDEGALIPAFIGDTDTGYVTISIAQDVTEGVTPKTITEGYIYRLHDGKRELLEPITDGIQIIDNKAPLNVVYSYELMMLTDESDIILTRYDYRLDSPCSFIYYGDEIFRGMWNTTFDTSLGRPERVEKRYSGREYPVSYDSTAMSESCIYNIDVFDRADINQLRILMKQGNGQGIWKSTDGDVYNANFELNYTTNRCDLEQIWKVTLKVTRIED